MDTPLFLYDLGMIRARVARLRAAMPAGVAIDYAVKANPFPPLLAAMAGLVDGFDIASSGELAAAVAAGAGTISFAGPGKRDAELAAAIGAGATISLESEGELDRALDAAEQVGKTPRLAVRVNPDFEASGSGLRMGGRATPFGVDAARAPALVRRVVESGTDYRGLHVYAGSQMLDAGAVIAMQRETVALAGRIAEASGAAPPLVNLGGGFGIPYFAGETPLDVEAVGAALGETLATRPAALAGARCSIELGRWLGGEAGVYLTRIVERKASRGETFLIVDGGMHHMLAAAGLLGGVVRRTFPIAVAGRFGTEPAEVVTVAGCLCTPLDRLAERVALPRAEVGDLIAIFCAGAYGASASPGGFLGHKPARELLVG